MGPRKKDSYTEESLRNALHEIRQGMSFKAASKQFGVPRSTLEFRMSNKFNKTSHGSSPVLSNDEETILVQ